MKKTKLKEKSWAEINAGMRKSWFGVNPVTKIIPDKRNKKPKHKGKELESE